MESETVLFSIPSGIALRTFGVYIGIDTFTASKGIRRKTELRAISWNDCCVDTDTSYL